MFNSNWNEEPDSTDQIQALIGDINLMMDEGLSNLNVKCLEEVREHMALVIEQGIFWLKQENPQRYVYDLENFLAWLCDFVEANEY